MSRVKRRRRCTRCGGIGKIDHWPAWEPKSKRIDCPACKGKGVFEFDLPKKLDGDKT